MKVSLYLKRGVFVMSPSASMATGSVFLITAYPPEVWEKFDDTLYTRFFQIPTRNSLQSANRNGCIKDILKTEICPLLHLL